MNPNSDRRHRTPSPPWLAGIAVAVLAAGSGTAWWAYQNLRPSPPPVPPIPNEQPSGEVRAQVYWLKGEGETGDWLRDPVSVAPAASERQVLEAALNRLLAGPPTSGQATTIPAGTRLLALTLEGGGIRVNLSSEFTSGGGSASMVGRLGQVLYTATSADPDAPVWLEVEGKSLEVLGGEGVEVAQPLTRREFEATFDRP